jgi:hypothetical protein
MLRRVTVYTSLMARPARQPAELDDPPIHDPASVPTHDPASVAHAYRYHRQRRNARVERDREHRRARWRFWLVAGCLLLASLVIAVTIWDQVQTLFGL